VRAAALLLFGIALAMEGACSSSGGGQPDAAPGDAGAETDGGGDVGSMYPIPTAVRVPVASAPASLPPDTHAFCIDSGNDTTFSDSCWVVKWGRWTYWVLTHSDSRLQMLITPFDAAGVIAPGGSWPLVKDGARYVMRLSVDENVQTVTIVGQVDSETVTWAELRIDQDLPPRPDGGASDGSDGASDGPDAASDGPDAAADAGPVYTDPTAVQVPRASAPATLPDGTNVNCVGSHTDTAQSSGCWVVKWGRWTYWAFSYFDNRSSFLITPYDETGALATQAPWPQEKTGARYLWFASIDTAAQTVTFFGQKTTSSPTGTVTMAWSELRIDQP